MKPDPLFFGLPYEFWFTGIGGLLAICGGFCAKLFSDYRDQLARDQQTLMRVHKALGELGVFLRPEVNQEYAEDKLDKSRLDLEVEVRQLAAEVRCRKYRALAAEAMIFAYDSDRNVQYMLKKLRAAGNPRLYSEVDRLSTEAKETKRACDLDDYMDNVSRTRKPR